MDSSQLASDIFEKVSNLPSPVVYCTIVGILLACGLGIPMPEDITLIIAGLLASTSKITFVGALASGFCGVLLGDMFLFYMGRKFGKSIFRLPGFRSLFTPERVASAEARIRKHGPFICFIARFLPGVRSAVFAMSGALGVRFLTFILLDGLAAGLSVPLWVWVGYWVGKNFDDAMDTAVEMAQRLQEYLLGGLIVLIVSYVAYKLWRRRKFRKGVSVTPSVSKLE